MNYLFFVKWTSTDKYRVTDGREIYVNNADYPYEVWI